MHDPQFNIMNSNEKFNGFKKNLELWKINTECNIFDVSPTFRDVTLSIKQKLTKKFSSTIWMPCRNNLRFILYTDVSKFK